MTVEPQPPDGEKIATEVEREMEQRLYRLRHIVLAPAEYHVYLHPDDFAHIKDVASLIELDVQQCLNAAVERMNGRSSVLNFVLPKRPPVEIPRGGWAIHIKPALNGDVGPGELAIHSRLSVPPAPKFGSGAGTVRIAQTVVSGTERRTLERDEPHTAAVSSAAQAPVSTRPRGARLTYSDETGEHDFAIAKELVKIGRGGAAHWVDVALVSGSKVSREHCRIRRDASGRYFLQDLSSWGTFLNGQRLPKFDGSGTDAQERELGDGSSIRLADQVTLEFHLG